jgi:hypothetical protein
MIMRVYHTWRGFMLQLVTAIPDVDALLALEPEELGAKMLFLMRGRQEHQFHLSGFVQELNAEVSQGRAGYPNPSHGRVELALREAWAWLTGPRVGDSRILR